MRCRHLALMVKCFQLVGGHKKINSFATFRVELIVNLFERLADLHNFELVLSCLCSIEHAMLLARVGHLSLFNPMKPEGAYELDLSVWDQRQVTKALIHLAIDESGVNWIGQKFKFSRTHESILGWEMPVSWLLADGLPKAGILCLTFYSGNGLDMHGCKANVALRKSLLPLCLVSSSVAVMDADDDEDASCLSAAHGYAGATQGVKSMSAVNAALTSSTDLNISWVYKSNTSYHV